MFDVLVCSSLGLNLRCVDITGWSVTQMAWREYMDHGDDMNVLYYVNV